MRGAGIGGLLYARVRRCCRRDQADCEHYAKRPFHASSSPHHRNGRRVESVATGGPGRDARHRLGGTPVQRLNARLNAASDS